MPGSAWIPVPLLLVPALAGFCNESRPLRRSESAPCRRCKVSDRALSWSISKLPSSHSPFIRRDRSAKDDPVPPLAPVELADYIARPGDIAPPDQWVRRWFTPAGAPQPTTTVFTGLGNLQFSLACLLVPYLKRFEHPRC